MKFHQDPNNPNEMICDDCFQALEDINFEWQDEDEFAHWDPFGDDDYEEDNEDE